ncbi:MAG: guanylate kinase [Chloroflexia bacterium]|nr:guanylate kinase [Chloroflexia bacterium]
MSVFLVEPPPLLVVLSGPSGVGKDAVMNRMKERQIPFHYTVTATTRPARSSEVHGKDYYFISMEEFQRLIDEDELLEWALVYGDYKGIPKQQVRDAMAAGQDVLMRIDVQGAGTIRGLAEEALLIFLAPPSMAELARRLRERKTETAEALERRLQAARREMHSLPMFDYVVVNYEDRLDQAVDEIGAILQAEKLRVQPRRVLL